MTATNAPETTEGRILNDEGKRMKPAASKDKSTSTSTSRQEVPKIKKHGAATVEESPSSSPEEESSSCWLPSWRELLTQRGELLWKLRTWAFSKNPKWVVLDIHHHHHHQTKPWWWTIMLFCRCFVRDKQQRTTRRQQQQQRENKKEQVMILGCPHLFCQIEKEQDARCNERKQPFHGLDKPDTSATIIHTTPPPPPPRPLNVCIGAEWKRQRHQVQSALEHACLVQRSLQAARDVPFWEILQKYTTSITAVRTTQGQQPDGSSSSSSSSKIVDWRSVVIDVANVWVVRLFGGHGGDDIKLEQTCLAYWEVARSLSPVAPATMDQRRQAFVKCLLLLLDDDAGGSHNEEGGDRGGGGVFFSLLQSGLSQSEAIDNTINAMIAALDAVQALLFWTIWNISKDKRNDGWRICQDQVRGRSLNDKHHGDAPNTTTTKNDLEGLAQFKKAATQSEKVDYSKLSYLGRALCETVRVFPPVWTLPRTWPGKEGESDIVPTLVSQQQQEDDDGRDRPPRMIIRWSKLEVAAVNGATSYQDWDPNGPIATTPHSTYIASFGLGRRHCPGGTAALYAVYHFLTLVFEFTKEGHPMEECIPNHAIESTYLLPTLSVVGPQFFRVAYDYSLVQVANY